MITTDLSHIWAELDLNELLVMEPRIAAALEQLLQGLGTEHSCTGWLQLPGSLPAEELDAIRSHAVDIRANSQVLVVVGHSACPVSRSVYELLGRSADGVELCFVGEDCSTRSLQTLLQHLDGRDWSLNLVAKNSLPMEASLAARLLMQALEDRYGEKAGARLLCTTDRKRGALRDLAKIRKLPQLSFPAETETHYASLGAPDLLPLAAAGLDIQALLSGALEAQNAFLSERSFNNPVWQYTAVRSLFCEKGKKIELLSAQEPQFAAFGGWWQQLFSHSCQAQAPALFPVCLDGGSGVSGRLQQLLQGERILLETLLCFEAPEPDLPITAAENDPGGLNALAGHSLAFLQEQARTITIETHRDSGIPLLLMDCGPLNLHSLGQLIYFFQLSSALSALVQGFDPFHQPKVESFQSQLRQHLCRPAP